MSPDAILDRLSRLHPKAIDLSLDRIRALLDDLGNPERRLPPAIHVAGTNGKGSVVAYLRAVLEAAGHRTHAYTSPHLVRFNERIVLAGREIGDAPFLALLEECERVNAGRPITLFEVTTAAALLAFARTPADVLLLEVGLGGRLDTTNVVETQIASAITPVSMDHMGFLGDTIDKIAFEKAGILRHGVPAVVGPQRPEAARVIRERAEAVGAPLIEWSRDFTAALESGRLVYRAGPETETLPVPALAGAHQIPNAATAVALCRLVAPRLANHRTDRARGLKTVRWPARLQRLGHGPMVDRMPRNWSLWLDGGHNADAGRAIADHFRMTREDARGGPTGLILGMLNSKRPEAFLAPFVGLVDRVVAIAIPGEPNALPAAELAEIARTVGLRAEPAADLDEALGRLTERTSPSGRVLITGSLYLAGHVLRDHG